MKKKVEKKLDKNWGERLVNKVGGKKLKKVFNFFKLGGKSGKNVLIFPSNISWKTHTDTDTQSPSPYAYKKTNTNTITMKQ